MATVRELITTWGFKVDFKTLERMDIKINKLTKDVSTVGKNLNRVSKNMVSFGSRMSAFVTLPILGLGIATLKASGNFEAGMNKVDALAKITTVSLQQLEDQARMLGETTKFSATQAADAMGFMAQAGLNSEQIFNAMPDALNLASAAQIGLAETADLVTNVMAGMGIESNELGNAVDVLTKAFISSNTDLSQLGQAMKFAGPVAKGFGLDIETTAAILGSMGNAGIQASLAGTSLRGALIRLASPSKEAAKIISNLGVVTSDGAGGIRNLVDIMDDLSKAGISTTQIMEVFGVRAGPAMEVLISKGTKSLREFIKQLRNSGGIADTVAKKQLRGLNGAWITMKSAIEGLSIAIGKSGLLEFFTDLVKSITSLVRQISKLNPGLLRFGSIVLITLAIIGPLILAFGLLGISIVSISKAFILLKIGMIAARTAMLGFTLSMLIFPAIALILGLALAVLIDDFKNFFQGNKSALGVWIGEWRIVKAGLLGIYDQMVDGTSTAMQKISDIIKNPVKEIKGLISDLQFLPGFLGETFGITSIQDQSFLPSGGLITSGAIGRGTVNRNSSNNVTTNVTISIPEGTPEQQIAQVEEAGKRVVQDEIDLILRRLNNEFPEVE